MTKVFVSVLALFLAGCATPGVTVNAVVAPQAVIRRSATYAFLPEPAMREVKREFYERMVSYLSQAGYRMGDERSADYLIQVQIASLFISSISLQSSVTPHVPAAEREEHTFIFSVFGREHLSNPESRPLWVGGVTMPQAEFRAHEEALVLEILSHVGSKYKGHFPLAKEANQTPEPTAAAGRGSS